jgi:aspartyl protease family protein
MQPHDDERRIGKGMILGAWVLAIGLMTLFFQNILEERQNPNQNPVSIVGTDGSATVTLHQNRAGHYVASGQINGHPVTFLVDTGATNVAIPGEVARRLNLPRLGYSTSRTAAGDVRVTRTRLDQVRLGDIRIDNISASIINQMEGDQILLGMSFLRHLELTQRGGTLQLRAHTLP